MTCWLSEPIEVLYRKIHEAAEDDPSRKCDVLIIGSGYGAAMAALAIAEQHRASERPPVIRVLERGDEYLPDDFPRSLNDMPGYVSVSTKGFGQGGDKGARDLRALWDVRNGKGITTVSGVGLGGTSLVNANVAVRPPRQSLDAWPRSTLQTASGGAEWVDLLAPVYPKIEKLLGVQKTEHPEQFLKYRALQKTAAGLGSSAEAAPLTINRNGPTVHSTNHGKCNDCGNCVIGCHSGAKGSLNMNAWPLARQLKIELYTGATVRRLSRKAEDSWEVHCRLTRDARQEFSLRARKVILAAGTLGSTEILLRSAKEGLPLSAKIGEKFSTNGDVLLFGIGQKNKVGAVAGVPADNVTKEKTGPTIIGIASVDLERKGGAEKFRLEDGAVPFPIISLWQEMIASQSFFMRYTSCKPSAWHKDHPDHDFLAVSKSLGEHTQVLLAVGVDDSGGALKTKGDGHEPNTRDDHDEVLPELIAPRGGYFDRLHTRLKKNEKHGFDGGQCHPSLAWQLLPDGFADNFEGADDTGRHAISVHPLGGCCMAEDAKDGVVNSLGQVFNSTQGTGVHEDLYVLDGSIIPHSIGTNPFLTIAALSYRLASEIVLDAQGMDPQIMVQTFPELTEYRDIPAGASHEIPDPEEECIEAELTERLVYFFDSSIRSLLPWSVTTGPTAKKFRSTLRGFVELPATAKSIVFNVTFRFSGENAINRWLENPSRPLQATATLAVDTEGGILTTTAAHCITLGTFTGQVTLGRIAVKAGLWGELKRMWSGFKRMRRYRPDEFKELFRAEPGSGDGKIISWLRGARKAIKQAHGYLIILRLHAQWRELEYRFESDPQEGAPGTQVPGIIQLQGRKLLAYAEDSPNLPATLMVLPVELENTISGEKLPFSLEVDPLEISKGPAPLQLKNSLHGADALTRVAGVGAYFLRVIMQTHFWSFAAYSYKRFATPAAMEADLSRGRLALPPARMPYGEGKWSKPHSMYFLPEDKPEAPLSRLTRYQPPESPQAAASRKTIMLIHGLAHSGRVFWTDTIAENYVQYFLKQNYDVWILDHRTSASIVKTIDPRQTWDQIAEQDVPWAVSTIYNIVNAERPDAQPTKVHVFAHCIGAGAVSIAALQGHLRVITGNHAGEPMLASLALHAVSPWLFSSAANRARENVWALFKELDLVKGKVEPRPHSETKGLEVIFDRLASISLSKEELAQWPNDVIWKDPRGPGFARAIYTRYTIFWGRQWFKANVTPATLMEFAGMIGAVPIDVLQQVYFSITRGLLSSHEGENRYVRKEKFASNWTFPTFFLHGNKNTVFDMESSKLSADQLTRHRMQASESPDTWPTFALTSRDYARHNVWIDILEDYGHMDMIFGKNATADVCPRLDRFFAAADKGLIQDTYSQYNRDEVEENRFQTLTRARSHIAPHKRPLVGPIISNPRLQNGRATLRIWCEVQDFSANPATGLMIGTHGGEQMPTGDRLIHLPHIGSDGAVETGSCAEEFWLYDYEFTPVADMARRLWVTFDTQRFDKVEPLISEAFTDQLREPTPQHLPGTSLDWHRMPWFKRQFLQEDVDDGDHIQLSFLSGSCLYPGTMFDTEQSASVFVGMYRHVDTEGGAQRGVDHVILLGDQIYADASAGLFDPKTMYERFRAPYRDAFGSEPARRLFANVPTYFAIDDHEYQNDHEGLADPLYSAKSNAWLFQIHNQPWQHVQEKELKLWYQFESAGVPFFVFDTRMERSRKCGFLIGKQQRREFELWLLDQSATGQDVLFIGSGSPFSPMCKALSACPSLAEFGDGLLAYPKFLVDLIELLSMYAADKRIYWLSGDPHFSSVAQLTLSAAGECVSITQICSSGLYAPFAFANENPNGFQWGKSFSIAIPVKESDNVVTLECTQQLLTTLPQHFVRTDLRRQNGRPELVVQAYDASGEPVGEKIVC